MHDTFARLPNNRARGSCRQTKIVTVKHSHCLQYFCRLRLASTGAAVRSLSHGSHRRSLVFLYSLGSSTEVSNRIPWLQRPDSRVLLELLRSAATWFLESIIAIFIFLDFAQQTPPDLSTCKAVVLLVPLHIEIVIQSQH